MIFYDTTVPELPVFERFMADWGVRYEPILVGDEKQAISSPMNLAPTMQSSEMTKDLASANEYVIMPGARAITPLYQTQGWRTVTPLFVTSSASYGKQLKAGQTVSSLTKEPGDVNGPFFVGVLTEQNKVENLTNNYSRIFFGSLGMAADETLKIDAFLNSRFFVRAINYMNESADAIVVEPKYYTSTQLNILGDQAQVVFWLLVIIIPAGTLIFGFFMWARRRNM
jgi:ABC-type uncharacterized transport system involved in gliding motility auxiliary subunit